MNNIIKGPNQKEANYCRKGHDDDKIIRTLLSRELINNYTLHVIDIDYDEFYRKKDIDLLLYNIDNNIISVEVKADDFPALKNNIKYVFLELISNSKKYSESNGQDGLGCILTSKAKHFIFYFIKYDFYLVVNSQMLRDFIKENKSQYKEKRAHTWSPDNKTIWYDTIGIVVPVMDIVKKAGGRIQKSRYKYEDIKKELNI